MPNDPQPTTDQQALRRCLGRFATGVTVVTCCDAQGRPCGITVNSFSSVSLEPPLVLWNIAKVSNSLEAFLNAGQSVINVLAEHQHALASHFARSDHRLFDDVACEYDEHGTPVLPDTLATLYCSAREIHDCGDHYIVIAHVDRFEQADGTPLVFFGGRYEALAPPRSDLAPAREPSP